MQTLVPEQLRAGQETPLRRTSGSSDSVGYSTPAESQAGTPCHRSIMRDLDGTPVNAVMSPPRIADQVASVLLSTPRVEPEEAKAVSEVAVEEVSDTVPSSEEPLPQQLDEDEDEETEPMAVVIARGMIAGARWAFRRSSGALTPASHEPPEPVKSAVHVQEEVFVEEDKNDTEEEVCESLLDVVAMANTESDEQCDKTKAAFAAAKYDTDPGEKPEDALYW